MNLRSVSPSTPTSPNASAVDIGIERETPMETTQALERSLRAHADAVSYLGARTAVLTRFLDATLPHLTAAQSQAIAASLRLAMQDAIAATQAPDQSARHRATLRDYAGAVLELLECRSAGLSGA
ncbi:hypothetical protein [Trinickia sp.]|uniref:hypothetical protein n=1 Tax=Trinickia sp. TaxID=2571163 RepID=UPI003F7D3AC9